MTAPPQVQLSHEMTALDPENLLTVLAAVAEHGPIVGFSYGGQQRVLITDSDVAHRLLAEGTDEMRETPITDTVRKLIGDGLVTATAPEWRPRRLVIQRELSRSRMLAQADSIMAAVQHRIDQWCTGEEFDLQEQMAGLTLDNLGNVVFGGEFHAYRELIRRAMRLLQAVVEDANAGRHDDRAYAELTATVDQLDELVSTVIQGRTSDASQRGHLIDVLYAAVRSGDPAFAGQWLHEEAVSLITAGHDTTAFLTTMATYLIARHPEVMDRLRDQAAAGFSTAAELLERVPLAKQVVEETLRLYPPIAVLHRTATRTLEVGDFEVEAGTILVLSPWTIHRDSRYFVDPMKFDPDRFSLQRRSQIPRDAYFPFGGGRRICVGNHLAVLQATLIIALLAGRANIEIVATEDPVIQIAVTLHCAGELLVRMNSRDDGPSAGSVSSPDRGWG